MPELNDDQTIRYCRHILLPQLDFSGQEKLLESNVLLIGLGGLGSACLPYLSASGIGQITLVDFDTIETSNLQRQVIYKESDVGKLKVSAAAEFVKEQNTECSIRCIETRLDEETLAEQIALHDLVIDCTDNLATRQAINSACFRYKTPLVSGAAIRFEGQVTTFNYQDDTPCYHCFSHSFGEQNLSCIESGVVSPLVGIVGSTQALEAVKVLTGIGESYVGRLLVIDALTGEQRIFRYRKRDNCSVCSMDSK
ncbi:molybdopterin-synthase adenylyltransferase MoeB [Vibrio viridaestus]|uniref:Molybdopterin-synthase adenylyltransferase MoeB n=1 Tax=Vibrio viridaestus TaxID=2487322 RepID=A0A3N9TCG9_9VIBR|nr:molybdopterin-synthase adenylyltransferase MoeB [Vibrio viridaestus]RQW61861.1 molybdopterin-synthase adenylyltransferase MoeB [Vibrio viridaestus]